MEIHPSDSSDPQPARAASRAAQRNLGTPERWLSLALGLGVLFVARKGRGPVAWMTRAVGSAFLARSTSGRSELYRILGIDTRHAPAARGLRRTVTLGVPPERLRAFLLDPTQLPDLVPHVTEATAMDDDRWEIIVKRPGGPPFEIALDVTISEGDVRWTAAEAPTPFEVTASFAPRSDRDTGLAIQVHVDRAGPGAEADVRRARTLLRDGLTKLARRVEPEREAPPARRASATPRRSPRRRTERSSR